MSSRPHRRPLAPAETLEHRLLLATDIAGIQFHDLNANGVYEDTEPVYPDQLVQLFTPDSVDVISSGGSNTNAYDVAVDDRGNVYVANLIPPRIHRVNLETGEKTLITQRDLLQQANEVAVAPNDKLVVLDLAKRQLVEVDIESGEQRLITQRGKLVNPTDLAVLADGTILVTDTDRPSVVRVDPIARTQTYFTTDRELFAPNGITVSKDGKVFVSDGLNGIIQVMPNGDQVVVGAGSLLSQPKGVGISPDGGSVLMINKDQQLVSIDIETGRQLVLSEDPLIENASGLEVLPSGQILVADKNALSGEGALFSITPRKLVAEDRTDRDGNYDLSRIPQGDYILSTTLPTSNIETTPLLRRINVESWDDDQSYDIGSFQLATVEGYRYHDLNSDGVKDDDEPGLSDWTVYIDLDNNGVQSDGEPFAVTNEEGKYRIRKVPPGEHAIVSRAKLGWNETTQDNLSFVQRVNGVATVDLGATFNGDQIGVTGSVVVSNMGLQRVSLDRTLIAPVIFVWPEGAEQAIGVVGGATQASVTDVWENGFLFFIHDPAYLGTSFRYLAIEAGEWRLADGRMIEVGAQQMDRTRIREDVELTSPFASAPSTLVQDQTGISRATADFENGQLAVSVASAGLAPLIGWLAVEGELDSAGLHEILYEQTVAEPSPVFGREHRPNVLLLSIDDLNDWIGVLDGYEGQVHTPNLDEFFNGGATFSNAIVPSVECNPSRTSTLTGLYPSTTSIYTNGTHHFDVIPSAVTLPSYFRQHGYHTSFAGKVFHNGGSNDTATWDEANEVSNYQASPDDRLQNIGAKYFGGVDADAEQFADGQVMKAGLDFFENHDGSEFLLALGFIRPHLPWVAPQEYFDLYPLDEILVPEKLPDELDDIPDYALESVTQPGFDRLVRADDSAKLLVQAYLANISFVDAMVGRVLTALEESPYADNTIVSLWSDHGLHVGEKSHWGKKSLWDESIRVPFGIQAPDVTSLGQEIDTVVGLVDLFPTLTDLAGLPTPNNIDGESFAPLLAAPSTGSGTAFVMHVFGDVVRTNEWSLIQYKDGSRELYDMQNDPGQHVNLANDVQYHATIDALMADLDAARG